MENFRMHLGSVDQIPLGKDRCFTVGFHEVAVSRDPNGNLAAFDNRSPERKFKVWEENGNILLLFVFPAVVATNDPL